MNIKEISTKELVKELERREGVETIKVAPYDKFTPRPIEGPAILLKVID